jgi:hypothetical protein
MNNTEKAFYMTNELAGEGLLVEGVNISSIENIVKKIFEEIDRKELGVILCERCNQANSIALWQDRTPVCESCQKLLKAAIIAR